MTPNDWAALAVAATTLMGALAMGEEQVASLETSVANQIASQINPTSITLVIGEPAPVPPAPVAE